MRLSCLGIEEADKLEEIVCGIISSTKDSDVFWKSMEEEYDYLLDCEKELEMSTEYRDRKKENVKYDLFDAHLRFKEVMMDAKQQTSMSDLQKSILIKMIVAQNVEVFCEIVKSRESAKPIMEVKRGRDTVYLYRKSYIFYALLTEEEIKDSMCVLVDDFRLDFAAIAKGLAVPQGRLQLRLNTMPQYNVLQMTTKNKSVMDLIEQAVSLVIEVLMTEDQMNRSYFYRKFKYLESQK